jgi:3-oxoacyl-[acyl-carrier-protein] synthase-3
MEENKLSITNAYIHSMAYYLPKKVLTNEELNRDFPEWSEEKIFKKTGIKVRHIADETETVAELSYEAGKLLLEKNKMDPSEIDFIILCTQSPDYFLPTTACLVQEKLGVSKNCGAVDVNQGCSGFIYALTLGKSLINAGTAKNVLLFMADTYTKHINKLDKSTRTIFGDGASAVLLKGGAPDVRIGEFVLRTDGKGADNLIKPAGGMKIPYSQEALEDKVDKFGNVRKAVDLYMNGPKIFEFAMENVPILVGEILEKNNMKFEEIDHFVLHQANKYMLVKLQRQMKIPSEKFCINMENVGNTVSATIPIALEIAENQKEIKKGDKILIAGFGVGYSWGGTIITL